MMTGFTPASISLPNSSSVLQAVLLSAQLLEHHSCLAEGKEMSASMVEIRIIPLIT